MSEPSKAGKTYPYKASATDLPVRIGSGYPPPLDEPCAARAKTVLGDAVGLSQFGVNLLVLQPGNWSAQRHWHENEDELIYVLEGNVVLVTNEGETVLSAGDVAGFPAGQPNGHHLMNRSDEIARVLEVGTRAQNDMVIYPDKDLVAVASHGKYRFLRKNGDPVE